MSERPFHLSVVALSVILVAGTVGYMLIEGWGPLDAVWMVVITLTTIGYGEVHPLSPLGRIYTLGLIAGGVSVAAYAVTTVTREMLEGTFFDELRRRRRRRAMDRLENHFIVVGYGRLGRSVAGELRDAGVPFCVVERDPARLREAELELRVPTLSGDGSDDDILRAAGIARARGVAVAAGSGAEAMFTTLSARQLNPKVYIVTRVETGAEVVKARRAGADAVVSPYGIGGWRMAHGLLRPHASHFLDLATLAAHEEIVLDEFCIPATSPLANQSMRDLHIRERYNVSVVALRRADGTFVPVPRAEDLVLADDVLIVVGAPEGVRAFGAAVEGR